MTDHTTTCRGATIIWTPAQGPDVPSMHSCTVCMAYGPVGEPLPSGTDRAANIEARDCGEERSPNAE